ncbi:MAG TPA: hypothetical protein ENI07_16050 [Desulfobacterales bacterium]|nr:hypothetical protein [Desulfobacterales bacterium]
MPLDSDEIAELVRLDQKIVSDAISRLNDPKIGWIEEIPVEVGVRSDQGDIIGDNDRSYTPHHTTPHHSNMLPPVAPTSKKQIYPESFERLWKIHPKGNKKPAYRKFRAINPGDDLLTEMMTNVVAFQKSEQWRNGYAQDLSRWLNEEGWANFPPESHQETTAEMERRLNAENSG